MLSKSFVTLALTLLALANVAKSQVTVRIEIVPSSSSSSTFQKCPAPFFQDLDAKLTNLVLEAARKQDALSDFQIKPSMPLTRPSGNKPHRQLRSLTARKDTCGACNSAGCALSCGIGVCQRCQGSRRMMENENSQGGVRELAMNWNTHGHQVTLQVTPHLRAFLKDLKSSSNGCLGDAGTLGVNVTFLP